MDELTKEYACRMLNVETLPKKVADVLTRAKVLKDKIGSGQPLSLDSIAVCLAMNGVKDGKPVKEKKEAPKHNEFSLRVMELRKENTVPELQAKYEAVLGEAPHPSMKERSLAESIAKAEVNDG